MLTQAEGKVLSSPGAARRSGGHVIAQVFRAAARPAAHTSAAAPLYFREHRNLIISTIS